MYRGILVQRRVTKGTYFMSNYLPSLLYLRHAFINVKIKGTEDEAQTRYIFHGQMFLPGVSCWGGIGFNNLAAVMEDSHYIIGEPGNGGVGHFVADGYNPPIRLDDSDFLLSGLSSIDDLGTHFQFSVDLSDRDVSLNTNLITAYCASDGQVSMAQHRGTAGMFPDVNLLTGDIGDFSDFDFAITVSTAALGLSFLLVAGFAGVSSASGGPLHPKVVQPSSNGVTPQLAREYQQPKVLSTAAGTKPIRSTLTPELSIIGVFVALILTSVVLSMWNSPIDDTWFSQGSYSGDVAIFYSALLVFGVATAIVCQLRLRPTRCTVMLNRHAVTIFGEGYSLGELIVIGSFLGLNGAWYVYWMERSLLNGFSDRNKMAKAFGHIAELNVAFVLFPVSRNRYDRLQRCVPCTRVFVLHLSPRRLSVRVSAGLNLRLYLQATTEFKSHGPKVHMHIFIQILPLHTSCTRTQAYGICSLVFRTSGSSATTVLLVSWCGCL
jgi:hypothetical protein